MSFWIVRRREKSQHNDQGLTRVRGRQQHQRSDVIAGFEDGKRPRTKEFRQPLEARKARAQVLPRASEGKQSYQLYFSLLSDF